jgi:hypothetical protein
LNEWIGDARKKLDSISGVEKQIFNGTTDYHSRIQQLAREETLLIEEEVSVEISPNSLIRSTRQNAI